MSFNPSGLPTLPNCESDIARWAADLQAWVVAKLTTTHNIIDAITIDPFDICAEVGNLSAPTCLVPATGIDTAGFTYATEGGAAGPGVLPWPGSEAGRFWELYTLGVTFDAEDNWTTHRVNFPVPLPTDQYAIIMEPNTYQKLFWRVLSKDANGFTMAVANVDPGPRTVSLIWSVFYYGPRPS